MLSGQDPPPLGAKSPSWDGRILLADGSLLPGVSGWKRETSGLGDKEDSWAQDRARLPLPVVVRFLVSLSAEGSQACRKEEHFLWSHSVGRVPDPSLLALTPIPSRGQ